LSFFLWLAILASALPEKYRAWLEEEVVYLISDREKEVFQNLGADEECERFMEGFWEARDPTPGTRRNELREEHQSRWKEANRLFVGRGRPGWKTERGRLFILLGAPRERKSLDSVASLHPIELWFYEADDPRLPPHFYLIFFRRGGAAEFRLWDPVTDGPTALLAAGGENPAFYDRPRVLSLIAGADTDLYQAVTSPVPGEGSELSSQFSYQKVVAFLEDYPNQSLNPALAGRYQPGRGVVDVEYSFRKLDVAALTAVLPSASGPFVHYALEMDPASLSFAQYRSTYYTVFDVETELLSREGQPVYTAKERREVEVSEADWPEARRRPLSLQGRFPVVPGEFSLRFLIRSRTGRVFDRSETMVSVPEPLAASALIPVKFFREAGEENEGVLAFQVGRALAVPNPKALYPVGGKLRAFLRLPPGSPTRRTMEVRILRNADEVQRTVREGEAKELLGLDLSLADLPSGDYRLEIGLGGGESRVMSFQVASLVELIPPLVNSPLEPPDSDAAWSLARARQHLALQQNESALARLEEAVASRPQDDTARAQLGVLALAMGRPDRALATIEPGLMRSPFHYELLALAGFSCEQLGRPADAIRYYERARQARAPEEKLLRALAALYEKQGDKDKAEAVRSQIPR